MDFVGRLHFGPYIEGVAPVLPEIFASASGLLAHPIGYGGHVKKFNRENLKFGRKIQRDSADSPCNFAAVGSILTNLCQATHREAGVITWV